MICPECGSKIRYTIIDEEVYPDIPDYLPNEIKKKLDKLYHLKHRFCHDASKKLIECVNCTYCKRGG